MKTLKLAIFCFLLSSTSFSVFGGNSTGETITFTVDAKGYTGLLNLMRVGESQFDGKVYTFTFAPENTYSCALNTGATFQDVINGRTSDIYIYFNKDHTINRVVPASAATINNLNPGIVLKTSKITINPKSIKIHGIRQRNMLTVLKRNFIQGKIP
jgi:hypothetical protein